MFYVVFRFGEMCSVSEVVGELNHIDNEGIIDIFLATFGFSIIEFTPRQEPLRFFSHPDRQSRERMGE